jgi:transposase InsO family protein
LGLGTTRDTGLTRGLRCGHRRRRTLPGLIFHSDRGSEYASATFPDFLALKV